MANLLMKDIIVPYMFSDRPYFSNGFPKDAKYVQFSKENINEVKVNHSIASKMYTLKFGVGVELTCSELTKLLVFTKDNKVENKMVRELTTDDFVLQPYGYFTKYFSEEFDENLSDSLFYVLGLWYGRGERFYQSKPCVRFDKSKDYDICNLIDGSKYVESKDANGSFVSYYFTKEISKNAEQQFSAYFSLKHAYQFTRGVIDGCGFIYYGENHNSDLGIKFQSKSKFIAKVVQTVFQSLGVISYCSENYKSELFNAKMSNFDLRIRGKNSVGNFCRYFGFTNSFKNQLAFNYFNSIERDDYVQKGVGVYLSETYPTLTEDTGNLDESIQSFLNGDDNLERSNLSAFTELHDTFVDFLKSGGLISTIKDIEISTGYFTGKGMLTTASVVISSVFVS